MNKESLSRMTHKLNAIFTLLGIIVEKSICFVEKEKHSMELALRTKQMPKFDYVVIFHFETVLA